MKDDSFVKFVEDQLSGVPEVRSRRMFGGWGLYSEDRFFGIVSDEVLYFKTNEVTRQKYVALDSTCFRPSEEQVLKNYYEVPADVLENPEQLSEWAIEAANI